MAEKIKIFISSPIKGLEKERELLIESLKKEYSPEAMELWVASPKHPRELCLKNIRNSDLVLLISGPYYGTVDAMSGKSYTELEYDEADAYKIDVIHFFKTKNDGKRVEFQSEESSEELNKKHTEFFNKIWQFRKGFSNPEEFVKEALKALKDHGERRKEKVHPFVNADEYYKDFLHKGSFRHDYELVGREQALRKLVEFSDSDSKVFVLSGRGGLGKSKLCYEYASLMDEERKKSKKQVLFLRDSFNVSEIVLREIPDQESIIILDDAHRYDDLDSLMSIFKGHPHSDKIKIILASRPIGTDKIKYALAGNIPTEEVEEYDLEDLEKEDIEKLALNVLDKKERRLAAIITELTSDCPLATVVACNLINEDSINPNALPNKEEFQKVIFDRFLEDCKGKEYSDPLTQKLLDYISALSPIMPSNQDFRQKMSALLKVPIFDIVKRIDELENKGLLVRAGRLVRIAPDLLSDHILYNACVSNDGVSSNFAEEVVEQFQDISMKNILSNISELEWRSNLSGKPINLLDNIWEKIKDDFRKAPVYKRLQIIKEIEKAAVFQPKYVLDIINIAMEIPASKEEIEDDVFGLREMSDDRVLEVLPNLLKQIAFNFDYFERCCDLLWCLGKGETRELNPYPESPLRILQDLARYGRLKPIEYNEKMLECIKKWLVSPDAFSNEKYSPLDILVKLLEKEGEDTFSRKGSFVISSFALNFKALDPLRKETIAVLKDHLTPDRPKKVIFKALDILISALSNPPGLMGRKPSEEEYKYLEQEKEDIFNIIKESIPILNSQAMNVLIRKDLRWYQLHGRTDNIKKVAKAVVETILEDDEFRIYRALIGNYREYLEADHDWEKHNQLVEKENKEVAELIVKKFEKPDVIFSSLNFFLNDILEYKLDVNPNVLLSYLAAEYPEIALELSSRMIDEPDSEISKSLSSLIWRLKSNDKFRDKTETLIEIAIKKGEHWICLNIAHTYSYGSQTYSPEDYGNIDKLLLMQDKDITNTLIHAISKIGQTAPKIAHGMCLSINLEMLPQLADQMCSAYNKTYGISLDKLDEKDFDDLYKKLLNVNIFTGQHFHADELLQYGLHKYTEKTIEFLIKRLKLSKERPSGIKGFAPLPYLDFKKDLIDTSQIEDFKKYIRQIRNLAIPLGEVDAFWLPRLFKLISNKFSQDSIDILTEWLEGGGEEKCIAISRLLREASQEFLFKQYEFVGKLLEFSRQISKECHDRVKSNLFGIAVSGMHSRGYGQPSAKNIQLQDKGNEIAQYFNSGHPARSFYQEISDYGKNEIKEELARDQELDYE